MKKVIKGVVVVAILGCAAFFAYKAGYLDKILPVSNEKTPNVVENIRDISELITACYYEEVIQREQVKRKDSIIIVANGTVRAGFNLKDLGDEKIILQGDSVLKIILPKAQVFSVIVNPLDWDYIEGDELRTPEVSTRAVANAEKRIKEDALNDGILEKATESGKKQLTEMFKAFGFKEVQVDVE